MIGEGVSLQALWKVTRLTGASGKSEGVTNAQLGEVNINLRGVYSLTAMMAVHLLGSDTFVKQELARDQASVSRDLDLSQITRGVLEGSHRVRNKW